MLTSNFSFGGIVQIVSLVQPVTVTTKKTTSIAQWTKHTEKQDDLALCIIMRSFTYFVQQRMQH
jgi:hypothetical protein